MGADHHVGLGAGLRIFAGLFRAWRIPTWTLASGGRIAGVRWQIFHSDTNDGGLVAWKYAVLRGVSEDWVDRCQGASGHQHQAETHRSFQTATLLIRVPGISNSPEIKGRHWGRDRRQHRASDAAIDHPSRWTV